MLAVGRDAAKTLKKAIDDSKAAAGKEVPPLRISVAAMPIANFIAQIADDDNAVEAARRFAEALKQVGNKDHVIVTAQPIPQGVRVRLDVEEGLVKAVASEASGARAAPVAPAVPMQNAAPPGRSTPPAQQPPRPAGS